MHVQCTSLQVHVEGVRNLVSTSSAFKISAKAFKRRPYLETFTLVSARISVSRAPPAAVQQLRLQTTCDLPILVATYIDSLHVTSRQYS